MPFTDVSPPEPTTSKTGISFGISEGKRTKTARITLTAQAQKEVFGGSIVGKRFCAKVGRGQDEGRLLLIQVDDGELEAKASMRGSASIKMKAWDLLPNGKVPSQACELIEPSMGGFVFQLPKWARPSGVGGKMEQEHGIKRASR